MKRLPRDVAARVPGRALAWAESGTGWLVGTRTELVWLAEPPVHLPWEQVEAAHWNADDSLLRVSEIGEFGTVRASYSFTLTDPGRLLELVRERITASVVLQRHVPIEGSRGFRVIARRGAAGMALRWMFEYDEGIDPADPAVVALAEQALARAQGDVGDSI